MGQKGKLLPGDYKDASGIRSITQVPATHMKRWHPDDWIKRWSNG